jgi:hypothetical protein
MKKIIVTAVSFLLLAASVQARHAAATWPEKDAFHAIMSATYHPAEEGKFEPIKTRIGEMVTAASAWQKSEPPAEFNKPEIKQKIKDLAKGCKELQKMIKKEATDAEIKTKFTVLHDIFHDIVGMCTDSDEKH